MTPIILDNREPSWQKHFSRHTESYLRMVYQIEADHRILCALWLKALSWQGFIVTDKALYWNISCGATKDRHFLKKTDTDSHVQFSLETVLPENIGLSAEEAGADTLAQLVIESKELKKSFYFKNLDERHGKIMLDILHFVFNQGEVPQIDLSEIIVEVKPSGIRNFTDCIMKACCTAVEKIREKLLSYKCRTGGTEGCKEKQGEQEEASPKENATTGAEAEEQTTKETGTEKIQQPSKKTRGKGGFRTVLAHCLDFLASLIFVFAVIIAIKPELLEGVSFDRGVSKVSKLVGNVFLQMQTKEQVSPFLVPIRNLCVSGSLLAFLFLKTMVVLLVQGQKKFVAFIMLALTILSCWLVADKFLLFLCFCLLLNIGFQLLCDFTGRSIGRKLILLFISTIILYLVLHIVGLSSVRSPLERIITLFKELIPQFALPVFLW